MTRFLLAVALLAAAPVAAQTNITYVRPSKGKALTVASGVSLDAPGAGTTSAVYDWTAFMAAQVRVSLFKNGTTPVTSYTDCNCDVEAVTSGAPTPDGVFTNESDFYAQATLTAPMLSSITFNLGNLSPYVKFTVRPKSGSCTRVTGNTCTATVSVVPFPLDQNVRVAFGALPTAVAAPTTTISPVQIGGVYRQYNTSLGVVNTYGAPMPLRFDRNSALMTTAGYASGNNSIVAPVAVGAGAPATVYTVGTLAPSCTDYTIPSSNVCFADQNSVTIQNVGVVPAFCNFIATTAAPAPSAVSPTSFQFVLAAGAVAGDGTGGERTFSNIIKPQSAISCITAAGATSIAVMPF